MPVTFQVVGNLADFGNDPRADVLVRAHATPSIKVGDVAVHSNEPEAVKTDGTGAFTLELVSLPGVWYRIHTPYSGAIRTVNLAGYIPNVDDPTTGEAFPDGTVIDLVDVVDEDPTPGYEAVSFGGTATWETLAGKPTLGTAAATDSTDYASAAQGAKADTAVQPADLTATLSDDPAVPLVTKLDQRAPAAVVAVLGDSTGLAPTTGKWVDYLAAKIGARWTAAQVRTRQQVSSVYPAPTTVANGAPTREGASDTFTRTAANLVGTLPNVGGAWESTSSGAKYTVDGSKAVFTNGSTGVTAHRLPTVAPGKMTATIGLSFIYDGGAHVGAYHMISGYVNSGTFLWIEANMAANLISFKKATTAGGTVVLGTKTRAEAGITALVPAQAMTLSISHVGDQVTFTAGAATATYTLSAADSALFATGAQAGVWGITNDHSWDGFTIQLNADPATVVDIYNGSASSTAADWPLTRLDALLPVRPDVVLISYGHNHAAESPETLQGKLDTLVSAVRGKWADVPVVIVGQNPQKSPATNRVAHNAREASKRAWCRTRGYGYLPAFEAFQGKDFPSDYIQADGVHPTVTGTADGSMVWAQAAQDYLAARSLKPA